MKNQCLERQLTNPLSQPRKERVLVSVTFARAACIILLFCAVTINSRAQTFTKIGSFTGANGTNPDSLVQGTDGNSYGLTTVGGSRTAGTFFRITPAGKLTVLYDFCAQSNCTDGAYPVGLTLGTDGNFYAIAQAGGTNCASSGGCGTVFKISASGALSTLASFCSEANCADGSQPSGGMVQASDGNFYGTTYLGGHNCKPNAPCGTIFRVTPTGKLTILYRFCSQSGCADGGSPWGRLIQASDGNLYGTTFGGGSKGYGTVYRITLSGQLTTLYSFCSESHCTDGAYPLVVEGTDGNLYGITFSGGVGTFGSNSGTIFKITPTGTLTTLYRFCSQQGCSDGMNPGSLVQGTDGNFYGPTVYGGAKDISCVVGCGTVFEITPTGTLTTLHTFNLTDGFGPGRLIQATDGAFYGTTTWGGSSTACQSGCGTVFSMSVGLAPFVEVLPASGKVGAKVKILENNLTGATSVTFNGTAAAFKAVSGTQITTTVPAGATAGTVEVTTPSGVLKSNVVFNIP